MLREEAKILKKRELGNDLFHLALYLPLISGQASPGQFIHISCHWPDGAGPLLPRPFSIFRYHQQAGTVEILFRRVGKGTELLSKLEPGSLLPVLGPLGRGFSIPSDGARIIMIAGGIGMPPLFCLAEQIKNSGISFYYGGKNQRDLVYMDEWKKITKEVYPVTEDGSLGGAGLVTDRLSAKVQVGEADFYYACGPRPMLKAVQKLMREKKIPGELSLEEKMACGVGACLGCACQTDRGYQRVCTEGPVFPAERVIFDE